MARIARVVAAKYPHHITQRGNRRQDTFFCDDDYRYYIGTLSEWCKKFDVEIWAYCLMPNHVHLIAVPETEDGLRRSIGETHRRYTRQINFREKWKGHLWQGRFSSFVMDEQYLLATARYIELNPVKAKLVKKPEQYQWSSSRAHRTAKDDQLVKVKPLLKLIDDWGDFLSSGYTKEEEFIMRRHKQTGRPLGSTHFIKRLENTLDRILVPKKGVRPRKHKN
ncbi:MAG: transposase [Syntrophaceae bacterium]|nr:transposase [Syntrophaceae bacterium]